MKTFISVSIFVFALSLFSTLVKAKEQYDVEKMKAQASSVKERLNLTESQEKQIKPILEKAAKNRKTILADYGIDLENLEKKSNLGFMKLMKLRGELSDERGLTKEELEKILSDEQMDEFEKVQDEIREKIKARIMANRK